MGEEAPLSYQLQFTIGGGTKTLFVVEEFSPIPRLVNQGGSSSLEKLKIKVAELDVVFSTWSLGRWKSSAGIGGLEALNAPEIQVLSPFHLYPIL